jgi:hypothetical protein
VTDPATVPGYGDALAALEEWQHQAGMDGSCWCWSNDHVESAVALIMLVARPHMQAELFADLSDKLADDGFEQVSLILDHTSHELRRRLDGHR